MSENEREKRVEKVVTGAVTTQKTTKTSKIMRDLISEDANTIGEYLVTEVVVPKIKDFIDELVTNGVRMMLWGTSANRSSKSTNASRVSYSKYYSQGTDSYKRPSNPDDKVDYEQLIFDSRADAEDVLNSLIDLIETYQNASILDLYDLTGHESKFTDQKYGWTNLGSASVQRVKEGYLLKLPKPKLL